jgi:HAE1 family hydrophobic/amphiphilic exporter-1
MNVTEFFIRRPVLTTLIMLGLMFFGIVAYTSMPVSYLPAVDFPTIQVSASLPGGSPKTMASSVALPLEREFSSIAGLESMNSVNSLGATTVTLQFSLDRPIDGAALDVQSAITRASGNLPGNMDSQPTFEKVNPSDTPVLYMVLRSDTLPLSTVNDYAKTFVTQTISTSPGVAQVMIYGEQKYSVRVRLDPDKLSARSIGLDEVQKALDAANVNLPLGTMEGRFESTTLDANGQIYVAEEYAPVIIAYRDGRPVRLRDLGTVEDGVENERFSAWFNGNKNILVAVKRQPGSNTIEVVEGVRKMLTDIQKQLPASIKLEIVYDMSEPIKEAVQDVKFTLLVAVGLVVLVVFLFLRSPAATFIASVAIPFSIIATFAVMLKMGYTLDTLSLLALTLSVGFVVDDAVVMLENIVRHMEMGKTAMQAAVDGSREIGFTIISMTLSLTVVFIPILFMAGIIGRVLNEFAMTITIAILVSGVVSLSLTPMLSSRILGKGKKMAESDALFDSVIRWYEKSLRFVLSHRPAVMATFVAVLGLTAYFFMVLPKGFLPTSDMNYLMGFTMARQGISYESMANHQKPLSPILHQDPDVQSDFQIIGYPLQNNGMTVVLLKSQHDRKLTADQMALKLLPSVNVIPGLRCFLVNPPLIQIGGKDNKGDYAFTLRSPDSDALYAQAQALEMAMRKDQRLRGVNSDLMITNPQVSVKIDRDKASTLGITASAVEDALFSAYGERRASRIYAQNDLYKVIMEVKPEFMQDSTDLSRISIRTANGLARLDTVAQVSQELGPVTINHTGQLPSVTIFFGAIPGVSIGEVTAIMKEMTAKYVNEKVTTMFEGTAGEFQKSMGSVYFLLLLALVVIYIILGCLYESFIHPLTILSGLPSAALGGLVTLWAFGYELDLYGMVGVIMLIGIVKKNAIMVVDFALVAEAKHGKDPVDAAFEGSVVRFRPIIMTTLAAIMGALPIALGYGADSAARRPLGLVVVGGLVLSQLVTLYLTPVFYSYMDQLQRRFGGGESGAADREGAQS